MKRAALANPVLGFAILLLPGLSAAYGSPQSG
jgi:hypothetical protein